MKHFVLKIVLAQFIMMVCASIVSAQYIPLVDYTNQVWRYNDTSTTASNPQATYMTPGFDDSVAGWKTGKALFGNDDANVYNSATQPFRGGINGFATPLDRTGNRVTFYFRTHFNVASAPHPTATLFSTNYLDDGAVFYINGVEVGRLRVPTGALTWDTVGSNPATEGAPTRIDMPATALQVGDNVLAVEVHQSAPGSSDVAFAMNLILINPFCVQILDPAQPTDVSVVQSREFTIRAVADASPPISYQWVKDGVDITGATSPTYTVVHAGLGDEGNYYCRISNPVCTVNSRTNFVDVIPDQTPPQLIGVIAPNFRTIVAQFDEAMDPTEGFNVRDPFNWAITDSGGNPVGLENNISISADFKVVTLTVVSSETLLENTVYTVTVSAVPDYAGNLLESAETTFRSYTTAGCNSFLFEAFDTASAPGNAITLLTGHPNYPNNPMDRARIPSFDSRNAYSSDAHEQYGGRVRGLFVPTITGPHTFYLASDDASQLFVNPTGPDATGKQLVAQEISCCANFMPAGDPKTSVPINLTAGQAYYVEALYKEGTGGDWLKVAARPSSEPVPVGGNSEAGIVGPNSIQSGGAGPSGILGFVTIANNPANVNTIAGQVAQFTVGLSSDVPGCFQWKKNGADIPGAIGPVYRLTTTLADDNTRYSVVVSLLGGTILTSAEGVLRVSDDTTAPTALAASTDPYATNLTILFSEVMDAATTANIANYQVDGGAIAITTSTMVNSSTVQLTLAQALAGCATHTVRITGVKDQFLNTITQTNLSFLAPMLLIPLDAVKTWRYNDTGADLGTAWRATGYNDSAWLQGPGVLAFESATLAAPIRTTLIDPRTLPTPGSAAYFRTHFNLPTDPATLTSLRVRYLLDDGAVLFINGTEVRRQDMPAGEAFNTFSTRTVGDATAFEGPFDLPTSALVYGDNVIAASVHQVNATSSDLVFGLEMTAEASSCSGPRPRLSISLTGNQATITSTGAGTLYKASSVNGPWTSVGPAPQTVTADQPQQFFEIRP